MRGVLLQVRVIYNRERPVGNGSIHLKAYQMLIRFKCMIDSSGQLSQQQLFYLLWRHLFQVIPFTYRGENRYDRRSFFIRLKQALFQGSEI